MVIDIDGLDEVEVLWALYQNAAQSADTLSAPSDNLQKEVAPSGSQTTQRLEKIERQTLSTFPSTRAGMGFRLAIARKGNNRSIPVLIDNFNQVPLQLTLTGNKMDVSAYDKLYAASGKTNVKSAGAVIVDLQDKTGDNFSLELTKIKSRSELKKRLKKIKKQDKTLSTAEKIQLLQKYQEIREKEAQYTSWFAGCFTCLTRIYNKEDKTGAAKELIQQLQEEEQTTKNSKSDKSLKQHALSPEQPAATQGMLGEIMKLKKA